MEELSRDSIAEQLNIGAFLGEMDTSVRIWSAFMTQTSQVMTSGDTAQLRMVNERLTDIKAVTTSRFSAQRAQLIAPCVHLLDLWIEEVDQFITLFRRDEPPSRSEVIAYILTAHRVTKVLRDLQTQHQAQCERAP